MTYETHTFTLPEIKGIPEAQLKLHIGLYEGYVAHTNLLFAQMNKLAQAGEEYTYALAELRKRLGFEWNGMRLHELYFEALEGGSTILLANTKLYTALAEQYGSFSNWLQIFSKLSARGPGWAILCYDPIAKNFLHTWIADHEVGHLATLPILIAVDHWEHAYLGAYTPGEKSQYVEAYITALNWQTISARFDAVS